MLAEEIIFSKEYLQTTGPCEYLTHVDLKFQDFSGQWTELNSHFSPSVGYFVL